MNTGAISRTPMMTAIMTATTMPALRMVTPFAARATCAASVDTSGFAASTPSFDGLGVLSGCTEATALLGERAVTEGQCRPEPRPKSKAGVCWPSLTLAFYGCYTEFQPVRHCISEGTSCAQKFGINSNKTDLR